MVARRRQNDPNTIDHRYRSGRMIRENGKWYFQTREGSFEGPFVSESHAQQGLERYIKIANTGLLRDSDALTLEPM